MASETALLRAITSWRHHILNHTSPHDATTTTPPEQATTNPFMIPLRPGASDTSTPRPSHIASTAENAAAASSRPVDAVAYFLDARARDAECEYDVFTTTSNLVASDLFEGMALARTWGALRSAWNTSLRQSIRNLLPGPRLLDKSASTPDWIRAYRATGLSQTDAAAAIAVDIYYIFFLTQFPGLPFLPLALSASAALAVGVRFDFLDKQDDSKLGDGSVYDRAASIPRLPDGPGWLEYSADATICGVMIKDRETVWQGSPCPLPELCLTPLALMDLRWTDAMAGPFFSTALRLLGTNGPAGRIMAGTSQCGCPRLAMDQMLRYNELVDILNDGYVDLPMNELLVAIGLSGGFHPLEYQFSCNTVVDRISRCPKHDQATQDLLAGISCGGSVAHCLLARYNLLVEVAAHGPAPVPEWHCVPPDDTSEYDCTSILNPDWTVASSPRLQPGVGGVVRAAALRTSTVQSRAARMRSYEAVLDAQGGRCSLETLLGFAATHQGLYDERAEATLSRVWDLMTAKQPSHFDVAGAFLQYKSTILSRHTDTTGEYARMVTGLVATMIEATTLNPYARLCRVAVSSESV